MMSAPSACANGRSQWATVANGLEGLEKCGGHCCSFARRSVNQAMVPSVVVRCVVVVSESSGLGEVGCA